MALDMRDDIPKARETGRLASFYTLMGTWEGVRAVLLAVWNHPSTVREAEPLSCEEAKISVHSTFL